MKSQNKEKILSVPLDQDTTDEVARHAKAMDVSKAHVVRSALRDWLERSRQSGTTQGVLKGRNSP